ncbi:hypothetical protein NLJ89_g8088 [Agrocybe chaxingu]|uniref:Protein arginine methyltransferase NDUFAF7 n=1 Tax=Agrocybe chaxingu TaxID=84603 RepID=A0A9W8JVE3_9AGAR|nr:hypothetical protein NLJ89_g8088 [Agrocybe chaxingu]
MQLCLSHPTHGYYMNTAHEVFGSKGDFITSPEISQIFGEYASLGNEKIPFRLVELGAGRGTLMDDMLRVIAELNPTKQEINVHLVETSPAMRALQDAKLTCDSRPNVLLHWHDSISEIPTTSEYTMLVAHEFFDALPIHVIQKMETGWHEVLISSDTQGPTQSIGVNDAPASQPASESAQTALPPLRRGLARQPSAASTLLGHSSPRFQNLPVGSTLEVSPTAFRIARKVGELLEAGRQLEGDKLSAGGCGLIIDYGGAHASSNSFRAFKDHKIVDVFHEPGNCDLTANVDFAYLTEAMNDLVATYGPITQGSFLERMGLQLRLQGLLKAAKTDDQGERLKEAATRLVDPSGMGKEYQVLGITNKPSHKIIWPFVSDVKL